MAGVIICPKNKGNTRLICGAIADSTGWELKILNGKDTIDLSHYERVILATGIYASNPHKNIVSLIQSIGEEQKPKQVHVLLTWAAQEQSIRIAFDSIKKECEQKGIGVSDDYISSMGKSLGFLRAGHPSEQEIQACVEWAKKID